MPKKKPRTKTPATGRADEIRQEFLEFFEEKAHRIIPSASLLPMGDPTLLFTNAGMVQFKDVFTGQVKQDYSRAASSQKCVRAGGKHNDLENVGFTARHHTFFEMLGNFSFGDYFKAEAIDYAWEFLTKTLRLNPDQLYVTVFREDDEAEKLWQDRVGVPLKRISRHDEKDNFWAMGETGPCGPCSEIHLDQGPKVGCGREECDVSCDCDRFLEIWNLVFMQFNREKPGGELKSLPNPSIDTGMGLERLTAVCEGVFSNYEIDIIQGIISRAAHLAGISYGKDDDVDTSLRVIADHSRATAFLIADGVIPGNEGASYVLRRIMRRAIRHGKKLGLHKPFLFDTSQQVIEVMKGAYPELGEKNEFIVGAIQREERLFAETLDHGLAILEPYLKENTKSAKKILPGDLVFKLYDTFGFPVDLTQSIAQEKGFQLDQKGFEKEMTQQRQRSQAAGKGLGKVTHTVEQVAVFQNLKKKDGEVKFSGQRVLEKESKVLQIFSPEPFQVLKSIHAGDEAIIVTNPTPFYGESGGQVGDTGMMETEKGFRFQVTDTTKPVPGLIVHHGKVLSGNLSPQEKVRLQVDADRRQQIRLNHSATHLVHAALRTVLGKHVHQKGSLVAPNRLRFDFTHFAATDPGALRDIEDLCNEHVRANHPVETQVMPYKDAIQTGAMALFGEKYGDQVRVVQMGDFSIELCGGTHVEATGEIGVIRFQGEGGVASGVRRVEALTGKHALQAVRQNEQQIAQIASKLKSGSSPADLQQKIEKLLNQQKALEQQLNKLRTGPAASDSGTIEKVQEINGTKVLVHRLDDVDPKDLRGIADRFRDQIKSGIVVIGSARGPKVSIIVTITKDLTKRFHAGNLIKEMAKHVDGTGGGRPDMAQAGGSNPAGLDAALQAIPRLLQ